MPVNYKKYCLRLFTIALLISFIVSNVSLCGIIASDCESQKTSCCYKVHSGKSNSSVKIEKRNCCEIKGAAEQPGEFTLTYITGKQQFSTSASNILSNQDSDLFNIKLYIRTLSFNSPPKENIYLLYSNFRI